jgi:hypothetical protein
MNTNITQRISYGLLFLFFILPSRIYADFLDDVSDSVFEDPDDEAGLLEALLGATSWITAIFTFLGVIFLMWAWFEFKKKDVGAVAYTLGAVGGFFMTPLIITTLRNIANL